MARLIWGIGLIAIGVGVPNHRALASPVHPQLVASQVTVVPLGSSVLTYDGRPYAGDLVIGRSGPVMAVVNRLGFERYLDGIAEMPSNWPSAALEAQAVAARTYALWYVLTHPSGPAGGQICDDAFCQAYLGLAKTEGPDGSTWAAAVRATRGYVLLYQGRVIEALYGSSDGGQTLYGGVPWLPSVRDPQDSLSPEHKWSWVEPLSALAPLLSVPSGETLVALESSTRSIGETWRAADGSTTKVSLAPDRFRHLLNTKMPAPPQLDYPLPSGRYSVSTYGSDVVVAGQGDGNLLGMSQYGALGKAEQGWSAGQILSDYYGAARPVHLGPEQEPRTIGVTLDGAVASAYVASDGPAEVLDASGRVLAKTSGPTWWKAAPAGDGVSLIDAPASASSYHLIVPARFPVEPTPSFHLTPPTSAAGPPEVLTSTSSTPPAHSASSVHPPAHPPGVADSTLSAVAASPGHLHRRSRPFSELLFGLAASLVSVVAAAAARAATSRSRAPVGG